MFLQIIANLFLIAMVYFSIGFAHWIFYKRLKRMDFSVAALILFFAYVCSSELNIFNLLAVLLLLPLLILFVTKLNPWRSTKGFIASLMLFSVIVNFTQIVFGTTPKIGQISDFVLLFFACLVLFIALFLCWITFGRLLLAASENEKRLLLIKEAWSEKYIFVFLAFVAILFSSLEYLWIFNISIENGFRIALLGSLIALSSRSFTGLLAFSLVFSILESLSVFFLPSGFKDIVPLVFLIGLIIFRGEQNGLF